MRKECLFREDIEGILEGRRERGRRRCKLIYDIKNGNGTMTHDRAHGKIFHENLLVGKSTIDEDNSHVLLYSGGPDRCADVGLLQFFISI